MEHRAVGRIGFIRLAQGEQPRWREALVLGVEGEWLQLLVRGKPSEEMPRGLTKLEIGGKMFFLLGCPQTRFMGACEQGDFLALEMEVQELLSKGQAKLASDSDLHFMSAGESPRGDGPARQSRKSRGSRDFRDSSPSRSGSSSESSEDAVTKATLQKMRKSWLGEGISGEDGGQRRERGSRSRRHSLLKQGHRKEPQQGSRDQMGKLALKSLESEKDPLRAWMTMQMVKDLRRQANRSRSSSRKRCHSSRSSGSSRSSSEKPMKRSSAAKAVENYEAAKRRMKRRPLKYVKRYVRSIEKELGAEDRPFRVSEMGRKIPWGKQRTLQRCHYLMSETLELMLKEKWERAALQLVLNLKSLHQTALDGGDWSVGWLLCHLPDPFAKQRFGGDAEELQHVTAYLKSMSDLQRNTEKLRDSMPWNQGQYPSEENEKEKKPKKKGKGKGTKHEDDKTESHSGSAK
eukprot:s147_g4.t1